MNTLETLETQRKTFRKNYYSDETIQFQLLWNMQNREVVFLGNLKKFSCIRGIRIYNKKFMGDIFNILNIHAKNYNIYVSLAKFSFIPPFTKYDERKENLEKWFDKIHKHILEFDIFLDFDLDEEENRFEFNTEVHRFFNLLTNENVPFMCHPSSDNGYQILIPSECFASPKKFYSKLDSRKGFNDYAKSLITDIKTKFKLQYLDTVGVGSLSKIKKCPYSLCQNTVLLPINSFKHRKTSRIKDYKQIVNILDRYQIYNCWSDTRSNIANVNLFLKKYKLDIWRG